MNRPRRRSTVSVAGPRHVAPKRRTRAAVVEALDRRLLMSVYTVTSAAATDVAGTLRWAIDQANADAAADTIRFAPALRKATISLTAFQNPAAGVFPGPTALAVTTDVTIEGTGQRIERSTAAGTADFRLFFVAAGGTLSLSDLVLARGVARGGNGATEDLLEVDGGGGAGLGGAIFNQGTLVIDRSTLTDNSAIGGNGHSATKGGGSGGGGLGGPGSGIAGGGPNGATVASGDGGFGGGGAGGVIDDNDDSLAFGGDGGFGGGGGGGFSYYGRGGNGGFGGGGGGAGGAGGAGTGAGRGIGGFGGGDGGGAYYGGGGGGGGLGGAIFNDAGGSVTLTNSTLATNQANGGTAGPGINVGHNGQGGSGYGAAVFNRSGSVTIRSSTLAGNTVSGAAAGGGAVYSYQDPNAAGRSATLDAVNSILADSVGGGDDVVNNGGTVSGTWNLVSNSTGLGSFVVLTAPSGALPLADNGGLTPTMGLPGASAARNAGIAVAGVATDQRGVSRTGFGAAPDIGAFEVGTFVDSLVVTTADDQNDGTSDPVVGGTSLREALAFANGNPDASTITFAPALASATISLSTFQNPATGTFPGPTALAVTTDVTIDGTGQTIERSGATGTADFRLFFVAAGAKLSIRDVTLANGVARGGDGATDGYRSVGGGGGAGLGGAIFNQGTLVVTRSTLRDNAAVGGNGFSATEGTGGGGGGLGGSAAGNNVGGGPNGGTSPGGTGGFGGGGGGGARDTFNQAQASGGSGGFGGGGGGVYDYYGAGGAGGFGGGGGGAGGTGGGGAGGFGGGNGAGSYGGGGGGAGLGGAIFNDAGGSVTLTNSTVAQNTAQGGTAGDGLGSPGQDGSGYGGGVFNRSGTVTIRSSTLAGNTVSGREAGGGAAYSLQDPPLAPAAPGVSAFVATDNSIFADSVGGSDLVNDGGGISGQTNLVESGSNVPAGVVATSLDPQLGVLANNGGPTYTRAIPAGSPAVNVGTPALAVDPVDGTPLTTDQRGPGFDRVRNGVIDIGAFEAEAPPPVFSITRIVQADEGDAGLTPFLFTVARTNAFAASTVKFVTLDGSANSGPGGDFDATSGTLDFAAGVLTRTVTVNVRGDTAVEPDQDFLVALTNPVNGSLQTGFAIGRGLIVNDDAGPPRISVADASVTEGNSGTKTLAFKVTLSRQTDRTVTFAYQTTGNSAASGSDFTGVTGTGQIAAGQTSRMVNVTIKGDTTFEPTETFFLDLSAPTNATIADGRGVGTIVNDDGQPRITIADPTPVTEGNSGTKSMAFTAKLSNPSASAVTVKYATADGTAEVSKNDYVAKSGTLTFAAGETTKTVTVTIVGDTRKGTATETFFVNLSAPTNATILDGQAVGTILNDD